jgi:hypothetical protein
LARGRLVVFLLWLSATHPVAIFTLVLVASVIVSIVLLVVLVKFLRSGGARVARFLRRAPTAPKGLTNVQEDPDRQPRRDRLPGGGDGRRLAIRTVAVYSDADADAKHVAACDEAIHVGGSAPKDSYLRWERIIEAARATGAEAIHPGYGFLSENEEFAAACAKAGLVFIGPPAARHPGHGPEGRVQAADGKGGRATGARLPRRRAGPPHS